MSKIFLFAMTLIFSSLAFANETRLRELISKEFDLKKAGQSLSPSETSEKDALVQKLGIIQSSMILEEVATQKSVNLKSPSTVPQSAPLQVAPVQKSAPVQEKTVTQPSIITQQSPSSTEVVAPLGESEDIKKVVEVAVGVMREVERQKKDAELKAEEDKKAMEAAEAEKAKPAPKSLDNPRYSKEEKSKLLKKYDEVAQATILLEEQKSNSNTIKVGREFAQSYFAGKKVYEPMPKNGIKNPGYAMDRGSVNIIKDFIGPNDTPEVTLCVDSALTIYLEDEKLSVAGVKLTDNKMFFDAEVQENKRSIFVRQIDSVPEKQIRESELFLFRKSDHRPYLIKLVGVACPKGRIKFPKILFLKEREPKDEKLKEAVLPPEDMVIKVTKSFSRVNSSKINVYHFKHDTSSEVSAIAIEVVSDEKIKTASFAITNNDGDQSIKIDEVKFMEESSKLKSQQEGKHVYRYIIYPKVNKDYIVKKRGINLFVLNEDRKEYQHLQIDLLPLFTNQLKGGGE